MDQPTPYERVAAAQRADTGERVASLEAEVRDLRKDVNEMAADVRMIRDVMLTDTGARKGRWKTITAAGAVIVGVATLYGAFWRVIAKFFA